jgi:hypothetical protein
MAKIRNASGEDRLVPWLGDRLVLAGQVVDVPDDDVYAFTQQTAWSPADPAATEAHDTAEAERAPIEEAIEEREHGRNEPPARNAARQAWAAWALARNLATEEQLANLTRDQIRDEYGPTTSTDGSV